MPGEAAIGTWKPGDRVQVQLPGGQYHRMTWVTGTVRGTDEHGLPPGVRVDLDYDVMGVQDCYATHSELRPE